MSQDARREPAPSAKPPQRGGRALAPGIAGLRSRRDFVALSRARRCATASMTVQGRDRGDGSATVRVGFTCSRKVGGAVVRNRAKRRLREVARRMLPDHGRVGWDYALIGRAGATAGLPFSRLEQDFVRALARIHEEP